MHRFAAFVLGVLVLGISGASVCHAAVRNYDKLSFAEQVALQTSERRVVIYDQELATLDHQRRQHKISADEYQWKNTTLIFYIQQESLFQNAILVRRSNLPQNALEVLGTMEHGVMMVPIGVGYVVAACPQVLEFLACIH